MDAELQLVESRRLCHYRAELAVKIPWFCSHSGVVLKSNLTS
jgi:hypothetical protein